MHALGISTVNVNELERNKTLMSSRPCEYRLILAFISMLDVCQS